MRTSSTGKVGFTIVELIVVVVLVGVVATMIAPRFSRGVGAARLRESARRLLATAQYARDFAVTRRCDCRLVLDENEQRYALACQEDPVHRPGEFSALRSGVGRAERLPEGLRFSRVWIEPRNRSDETSSQRDWIVFDPLGRADAAIVQITDGTHTYSMLVSPSSAKVRLADGEIGELPNDRWDMDE